MSNELDTVISTWFVSDDEETSTFFPQIGGMSHTPEAKATYWRCIMCFFASSIVVNCSKSHVLFTNSKLPIINGIDVAQTLSRWKVRVFHLPITYRLPVGRVQSWGNQFYIFDIIRHLAESGQHQRYVVLDSDCLWTRPVTLLEEAITRYGVLTYLLDEHEYGATEPINGLSRQGMARFVNKIGGNSGESNPYFGGEIFAATRNEIERLAGQIAPIWMRVLASEEDAPKEEAHLLSILYAMNGYEIGTANSFIKRMWTSFRHANVEASDFDLTIWHLPSEKKFGFRDLFCKLTAGQGDCRDPAAVGFCPDAYGMAMGVPRRNSAKLIRDVGAKLRERLLGQL